MVEESERDAPRMDGERPSYKESESPFRGPGASDQANAASPRPATPTTACLVATRSFTPRLLFWGLLYRLRLACNRCLPHQLKYKKEKHGLMPC